MGKVNKASSTRKSEPNSSVNASGPNKERSVGIHFAETAWRVAIPFIVFSLGGVWLDTKFETEPIFTIIGVFVALAAVSVVVYKYVNRYFPTTFNQGDKDG